MSRHAPRARATPPHGLRAREPARLRRKITIRIHVLAVGLAATLGPHLAVAQGVAVFTPLPVPEGTQLSSATAVSDDGSVVAGYHVDAGGAYHAFRWSAPTGTQTLDVGGQAQAFAISNDGSVVAGYRFPSVGAFRWTEDGTQDLGTLVDAEFDDSVAFGISGDGAVVVGRSSWFVDPTGYFQSFRWTAADGMLPIGTPWLGPETVGEFNDAAYAVSTDGSVIVGATQREAYRWTAETGVITLGSLLPGSDESAAYGVSADGSIVVGASASAEGAPWQAFRWTDETGMQALGLPSWAAYTAATAVSDDGSVIAGLAGVAPNVFGPEEAFIWDSIGGTRDLQRMLERYYDLELPGWDLTRVTALSADGLTLVGIGTGPDDRGHGWHLTLSAIVPEPGTALLVLWGLVPLAARGFRHS